MGKKGTILFTLILIWFASCSRGIEKKIVFPCKKVEIKSKEITGYIGCFFYAKGENIYCFFPREPLKRLNINTGDVKIIGRVGIGPGEIDFPSSIEERDDVLYIGDMKTLRLLMFSIEGSYIKQAGVLCGQGVFRFCNDTLLIVQDVSTFEGYFVLQDIKGKKIIRFGDRIEYPVVSWRNRLRGRGLTLPRHTEWAVKDSILIAYEYYYDRLKVYNIFTGRVIKIFGRRHKGWKTPGVFFFSGDQYHEKSFNVRSSPCWGVVITDRYVYVCLEKGWLNWGRFYRKRSLSQLKKMYRRGYFFVDIYNVKDYSYIGTIYPLDESDYFQEKHMMRLWQVDATGNTGLLFYFQDLEKGNLFRMVEVTWNKPDDI